MPVREGLVTTDEDLREVAEEWLREPRLAVDTEFVSERSYTPLLCLVQVATPRGAWAVDALAVKDLAPLARVLEAPSLKVFHAAGADVRILETQLNVTMPRVLDTQVAAGFVGLSAGMGLKNLLSELLSRPQGPAKAYSSWDERPLSESQVRYALDDVRHLLPLVDALNEKIEIQGREDWLRQVMDERLAEWRAPSDAWSRFEGRANGKGFDARATGALKVLVEWREKVARERNWPPSRVAKDATLLELARERPIDTRQLREFRGLHHEWQNMRGREIVDAVAEGAKNPIKISREPRTRAPAGREDAVQFLQLVIAVACRDLGISADLVTTRASLEGVVDRAHRGEDPLADAHFAGWRRGVLAPLLEGLLDGRDVLALELVRGEFRMVRKRL